MPVQADKTMKNTVPRAEVRTLLLRSTVFHFFRFLLAKPILHPAVSVFSQFRNFTAVPYAITSAALCITEAEL